MSIPERFAAALAASALEVPGPELLPERLAQAAADTLPVDGAGLSLFFDSSRRLPLGASDQESAVAERLQFTVGEGPCLAAHATGRPIAADEATIRLRWPLFYSELRTRTAIRGIISLPLEEELRGFGALDLYLTVPGDIRAVGLADALDIAHEVVTAFQASGHRSSPQADGPAWLDAPSAERRSLVWQAMGFVNAGLGLSSPDALELLRAHAYSEGMDLDDLAARVLDREVPLESLAIDSDASP
jgi:hypothetical protein